MKKGFARMTVLGKKKRICRAFRIYPILQFSHGFVLHFNLKFTPKCPFEYLIRGRPSMPNAGRLFRTELTLKGAGNGQQEIAIQKGAGQEEANNGGCGRQRLFRGMHLLQDQWILTGQFTGDLMGKIENWHFLRLLKILGFGGYLDSGKLDSIWDN
jgi:hypothetical protein